MNPNVQAQQLVGLLNTPLLPDLGPRPRTGTFSEPALRERVHDFLLQVDVPKSKHDLVLSAALLWHDHLDASHTISQGIHTVDGSFLHALMHRREPDASNSKYWWHRVGSHACFPGIGRRAGELLEQRGLGALAARLTAGDDWDPCAFVDACERGRHRATAQEVDALKEIQRIEFETFVEHILNIR